MLIKDIFFYPNGHTVSGEGAIVVPRGKRLVLGEKDETEKAGNAGAIRVEDGGRLMVDEDFYRNCPDADRLGDGRYQT